MYRTKIADSQRVELQQRSGEREDRPIVLFVCVHNAGRSRMAEAFFNRLAGNEFLGISAGTVPAERPHPEVVAAMAEEGLDIPLTPGRSLTPELAENAVRVIGMGCAVEEACPALQVPLEDWALDDPKGKGPDEVAVIRDQIEIKVRNLVSQLRRDLE